ncbi:beta-2-microglobulin [Varanus komodoensis]|uniref:Beta-2-microglobulin n=1 Tax=Varanus komodoensis TaxID=61221 RepID=A0A8D2JAW0_VARKO|nr:beta-2-microglobulin [Varanus komodoensis]
MAKGLLLCATFLMCVSVLLAVQKPPTVQVYSRYPVEIGKSNILNCYVEGFHPPKINITLLKNEDPLSTKQTDLSFKEDWTFQLLTYAEVFPNGKDRYSCKVEHATLENPKIVQWDQEY